MQERVQGDPAIRVGSTCTGSSFSPRPTSDNAKVGLRIWRKQDPQPSWPAAYFARNHVSARKSKPSPDQSYAWGNCPKCRDFTRDGFTDRDLLTTKRMDSGRWKPLANPEWTAISSIGNAAAICD